jgi:membrane protein required for colicin V production
MGGFARRPDSRVGRGCHAAVTKVIAAQDPQAALGWVTAQYEQLVGTCGAPATPVDATTPGDAASN